MLSANGGKTCQASGRVVRTVAYKGFAVLFDQDDGGAIEDFIRELTPLPLESRAALLSSVLKPEIEITSSALPVPSPREAGRGLGRGASRATASCGSWSSGRA